MPHHTLSHYRPLHMAVKHAHMSALSGIDSPLHRYGGQGSEGQEVMAELLLFSLFTVCPHPSLLDLSSKCPLILLDISLFVIL